VLEQATAGEDPAGTIYQVLLTWQTVAGLQRAEQVPLRAEQVPGALLNRPQYTTEEVHTGAPEAASARTTEERDALELDEHTPDVGSDTRRHAAKPMAHWTEIRMADTHCKAGVVRTAERSAARAEAGPTSSGTGTHTHGVAVASKPATGRNKQDMCHSVLLRWKAAGAHRDRLLEGAEVELPSLRTSTRGRCLYEITLQFRICNQSDCHLVRYGIHSKGLSRG
jgi:hypothetical protein